MPGQQQGANPCTYVLLEQDALALGGTSAPDGGWLGRLGPCLACSSSVFHFAPVGRGVLRRHTVD